MANPRTLSEAKAQQHITELIKEYCSKDKLPGYHHRRVWVNRLMRLTDEQATNAIMAMLASDLNTFGSMPKVVELEKHLDRSEDSLPQDNCPCCSGSGWVEWPGTKLYRCRCRSTRKLDADEIRLLCKNRHCQNPGRIARIYAPPGRGDELKRTLKRCPYVESVTESHDWAKMMAAE